MRHRLILLILLSSLLNGCVGVFLAGAATGGMLVYDRRNLASASQDQHIRYRVSKRLQDAPNLKNSHISVTCFHGSVLLVGQAPSPSQKANAERIAQTAKGIRRLYNEIEVRPNNLPNRRAEDAWLTTKVKARLIAAKHLHAGDVKVITENSTVFLMGHLTRKQADLAVAETGQVAGVKRIVKVFTYQDAPATTESL